MPVDSPELDKNSPLGMLAGSRASRSSLASVSSDHDHGILDAFPLPSGIVNQKPDEPRPVHEVEPKPKKLVSAHGAAPHDEPNSYAYATDHSDSERAVGSPAHKAKERHLRYGHKYGQTVHHGYEVAPGYHAPAHSLSNMPQSPKAPALIRQHSASRSWDAGTWDAENRFSFPLTQKIAPLSSWQEHVVAGSQALADHDPAAAQMHWEAAASEPWSNELAQLLIQLALSERWFPGSMGPITHMTPVDTDGLRAYTAPITGRLIIALVNYAAKIKGAQYDVEALRCFEAAASLGSHEAAVAAAQIHFKGSRRIKRDAGKAQRFYDYANDL